jgi:hypothetical protein
MLTEIRCDALDKEFHTVKFRQGLNIVLGKSKGSSALGKTMFLQLIEFCFGGESYMAVHSDMREHVDDHIVYFTFSFDGEKFYFYRDTARLNYVCRCDMTGNLIEEMQLHKFRQLLSKLYGLETEGSDITACLEHYSRIYGKDNVQERYPYLCRRKEKDEEAVDFLLKLYGGTNILKSIREMEETLGVKASEFKVTNEKPVTDDQIQAVRASIEALKDRQSRLMKSEDDERLVLLGLNTASVEKASRLQKEMRELVQKRNEFAAKKNAILAGNEKFCKEVVEQDLDELKEFFPGVNVKALDDIQHFHIRIREILATEAELEAEELQKSVEQCDKEIADFQRRIDEAGYTREMTTRILSQEVSISREIEKKQEKLDRLQHAKETQENIKEAETRMSALISKEWKAIRKMQKQINKSMEDYNSVVTEDRENAPSLGIGQDKTINFGTYGNTSESTAFKGLVLYDLAILKNTSLPVLIHDSNIVRRINSTYIEKLFQMYEASQKQVFIALDETDGMPEEIKNITEYAGRIHLSEDHRLYGKSWANIKETER